MQRFKKQTRNNTKQADRQKYGAAMLKTECECDSKTLIHKVITSLLSLRWNENGQ